MRVGVAGAWYVPAVVASASAPPVPAAGVGATPASRTRTPTLRLERRCWGAGERVVVGIDEVGRGAWAGPVTVAALVPPPDHLRGVRDSKELTRDEREVVAARVRGWAVAIGVGHASYEECDALGMTAALRAAGRRALVQLAALGYEPDSEGILVLETGGKANMPLFARICNECGIPYVVLHDRDAPRVGRRRSSVCDRARPGTEPFRLRSPAPTPCGGSHPSSCR